MLNLRMLLERERTELRKKNLYFQGHSDLDIRQLSGNEVEYKFLLPDNVMGNHVIHALRNFGYEYKGKHFIKQERRNMNNVMRDMGRGIPNPNLYENVHKHVFVKKESN